MGALMGFWKQDFKIIEELLVLRQFIRTTLPLFYFLATNSLFPHHFGLHCHFLAVATKVEGHFLQRLLVEIF